MARGYGSLFFRRSEKLCPFSATFCRPSAAIVGLNIRRATHRHHSVEEKTCCIDHPSDAVMIGMSAKGLGCVKTLPTVVSTQQKNRTCRLGESFMRQGHSV